MSDKLASPHRSLSIRSSRLILRKAREDDLEDVHAFLSQEDAVRYWYVRQNVSTDSRSQRNLCLGQAAQPI
jgi:RimJ/RimL family protein N-acetyltransferase